MEQKEKELMIFLAGELRNVKNLRHTMSLHSFDYYAADGGYRIARKLDLSLKCVLGDFDSIEEPDLPNKIVFPCEKDQTDSEIALDLAIDEGYTSIWLVAPFGGRIDHTIANLNLIQKAYSLGVSLKLYDGENLVSILHEGIHDLNSNYRYVSFIPTGDSATVSLCGLKYPLDHALLKRENSLGISNEPISKEPRVIVHQDSVFCIGIEKEIS